MFSSSLIVNRNIRYGKDKNMDKYKIIFQSNLTFEEKINKAELLAKHEIQKTINDNIKNALEGQTVWSEFSNEYKNQENLWEKQVFYYYGIWYGFNKNDWRFCAVKDKRKQATLEKLVLCQDKHNLKQNHINDYNNYLENFARKR